MIGCSMRKWCTVIACLAAGEEAADRHGQEQAVVTAPSRRLSAASTAYFEVVLVLLW